MSFRFAKAAVLGTVLAVAGFTGTAAHAADATADARARVLQQVTVTFVRDLDFGSLVSGAAASTVTVTPAGARTCGAGLTCAGTPAAAAWTVNGTAAQVVTVSVPANINITGPGAPMAVSFTRSAATLTLAAGGVPLTMGGTLTVGANQVEGTYSGTFTSVVNYQ